MQKPSSARPDALALGEIDDKLGMRFAAVYYLAILNVAAKRSVPAGVLLRTAIAHEVGHGARRESACRAGPDESGMEAGTF